MYQENDTVRKLTLSAVSMAAVLGLSPIFSTAQAFSPSDSHTTCGGRLVGLAATRHSVEIRAECFCIDEECNPNPEELTVEEKRPELVCSTRDRSIIDFVYALIGGRGEVGVLLDARKGHHGYTCTKLALDPRIS